MGVPAKKRENKGTAEDLYGQQNKLLHRGFDMACMPYNSNKEYWGQTISRLLKREVKGISGLTLSERSVVLSHLSRNCSGKIFNPHVPRHWGAWKKGDLEPMGSVTKRPMHVPKNKVAKIRKIHAILADMQLPWSYVDEIAMSRFGVEVVEFLEPDDLQAVVKMMVYHQNRNGGPKQWGGKKK